jgi:cysteine-S-conjugate beta-lyase
MGFCNEPSDLPFFDIPAQTNGLHAVRTDAQMQLFGKSELLPMWVADMSFQTPPFILNAVRERLDSPYFGYTMRHAGFYEALVNWLWKKHGWVVPSDSIAFSPGVVPACAMIVSALTAPGDRIIVQPPVYFPFFGVVEGQGRQLVYNQLILDNGRYTMDFKDLRTRAAEGAKMIIISNPHNPGGSVWTSEELKQLTDIALEFNILILSDEIHSDLVFPPAKHLPVAMISPEVSALTITTVAPSKSFNIAGFSSSAVIITDPGLRKKYISMLDLLHVGMGTTLGNIAFEAAYRDGQEWLDALLIYLEQNLSCLKKFFYDEMKTVTPVIPQATYLVWLDCRSTGLNAEELMQQAIAKGLALSDGKMFGPGGEGFLRMNIACPRSMLHEALIRFKEAFNEFKN